MARYTKVLRSLAHNAVGNQRIKSVAPAEGSNYYVTGASLNNDTDVLTLALTGTSNVTVDLSHLAAGGTSPGGSDNDVQYKTGATTLGGVTLAKGKILSANSSGVPTVLAAGTNGYALVADSSAATGLNWAVNQDGNYYVTGGTYSAGTIEFSGTTGFSNFTVSSIPTGTTTATNTQTFTNKTWNGVAIADAYVASATNWNDAYDNYVASAAYSAGTLTFTQRDGGTFTATGFSQATGTIGGSIAEDRIAVGAATANTIAGSSNFEWDAATLKMTNASDTAITLLGDSNRTNADAHVAALRGKWNGTAIGTFMVMSGPDTTNKDDGQLTFQTASAGTLAERMRIDETGNVGIGTTTPGKKLHVQGAIAVSGAESAGDSGYGYSLYQYNQSGSQTLRMYSDSRGVAGGKRQFINVSGRLTMEATENMGIGPSTSGEYLHLYSAATAHMYLDAGDSFLFRDKDDSSAVRMRLYSHSGKLLLNDSSAATKIQLQPAGDSYITNNLGIGTTAPDAPLHILKAAGGANIVTALKLDPDDTTTNSGVSIDFNASTTNTGASLVGSRIIGAREGGNASGFLALYTSPDATSSVPLERMRIDSDGKVGIGTSSPATKLEVVSSDGFAGYFQGTSTATIASDTTNNHYLRIKNASTTDATTALLGFQLGSGYQGGFVGTEQYDAGSANSSYANLVFGTKVAGTSSPLRRMTILHNGKVGIGTDSPGAKLDVQDDTAGSALVSRIYHSEGSDAASSAELRIVGGNASTASLKFGDGAAYRYSLVTDTSDNLLFKATDTNTRMTLSTGGSLGVGLTPDNQSAIDFLGKLYGKVDANGNFAAGSGSFAHTSGISNYSGYYSTGLGIESLKTISGNAHRNTAVGYRSMYGDSTGIEGTDNTAVGASSMLNIKDGQYNVAVGVNAAAGITDGLSNTAIGVNALQSSTTANYNTVMGVNALKTNVDGDYNTAIGYQSMLNYEPGDGEGYNVAIGAESLLSGTTGQKNIAIGYYSLWRTTTGDNNVAVGNEAGRSMNSTASGGANNVFVGYRAAYYATHASGAVAIGYRAGRDFGYNNAAENNTAVGYQAGFNTTNAESVTLVGALAGAAHSHGVNSTAVGVRALYGVSGQTSGYNTAIGAGAMRYASGSQYNVAIGDQALSGASTGLSGDMNVVIGRQAMVGATTAHSNTAIGNQAGQYLTGGDGNTVIGYLAGRALTTGDLNVFIGYEAGNNTDHDTESNKLVIANSNTTSPLIGGDFSSGGTLTFITSGNAPYSTVFKHSQVSSGGEDGIAIDAREPRLSLINRRDTDETWKIMANNGNSSLQIAKDSQLVKAIFSPDDGGGVSFGIAAAAWGAGVAIAQGASYSLDNTTTNRIYRTGNDVSYLSNELHYFNNPVTINGVLTATAKSFNIAHPLYKDKRLVHGSLEGPEHGIYIRGTIEAIEGCEIELPEYWNAMCEDYTVQLTPHGPYTVFIREKQKDKVMVGCSSKNYKFDYYIVGSRTDETLEVVQDA